MTGARQKQHAHSRFSSSGWPGSYIWLLVIVVLQPACSFQPYEAEPLIPADITRHRQALHHSDPAFREFLQSNGVIVADWPIQHWTISTLTLASYYYHPRMQLALSQVEVENAGLVIAGQRRNPQVEIPYEHNVDNGDTPWLAGLVSSFVYERKEKREARKLESQAKIRAAEIAVTHQAWQLYQAIHAAMIEYYAAINANELLQSQKVILEQSLQLVEERFKYGQASEFELSSLRLELQATELLLADQRFLINDAYYALIANIGLQDSAFDKEGFDFTDLQQHLSGHADNLDNLQAEMVHKRYDMQQQLADYDAFEARLKLEIEKQYPDITLSPGYIYEQSNNLLTMGASWVLPLFHNNDGQIQEALALRKRKQLEIMALQTRLLNELARVKQNYLDKLAAYNDSLQLLDVLTARAADIETQYELGFSDRLSVLRSKLEIESIRQAIFNIELNVMRAAARMEATTQAPILDTMQTLNVIGPELASNQQ